MWYGRSYGWSQEVWCRWPKACSVGEAMGVVWEGQRGGMWEKLWVWYGRAKEVGCGRSYGCGMGGPKRWDVGGAMGVVWESQCVGGAMGHLH